MYLVYFSSKTTEASNNLVLYVRLPGEEDCYYPLFLKEKSVMALKLELAIKMNIDPNTIEKILNKRKTTFSGKPNLTATSYSRILVPQTVTLFLAGINVMVTDEMVASIKSESSYKINISSSTNQSADGVIITIQQTGV